MMDNTKIAIAISAVLMGSPLTAQQVEFDLASYPQGEQGQELEPVEQIPDIGIDILDLGNVAPVYSPEEVDAAAESMEPDLSFEAAGIEEPKPIVSAQPVLGAPSTPPAGSVFGVAQRVDPIHAINQQRQLLEQYNAVVELMREIKEQGNQQAVLAMLTALANDPEGLAILAKAFEEIEITPPEAAYTPMPLPAQTRSAPAPVIPVTPTNSGGLNVINQVGQVDIEPPKPVAPVVTPRQPIVPIFAQVQTEQGGRDKVIIAVGTRRFTKLPGETIEVDGRSILVESIEAEMHPTGRYTYMIHIIESGKREVLSWN